VIRATLYVTVKEGKEDDFRRAWESVAREVARNPANRLQALMRDADDERSFVISSDWDSREAFHAFERSPEQDALTAPLRELRESARMTVREVVVYVEGDA
jgi:heme-degrading monooxygenase HmoA